MGHRNVFQLLLSYMTTLVYFGDTIYIFIISQRRTCDNKINVNDMSS